MLDPAALLALTHGDGARTQKLVMLFQSSATESLSALAQALAAGHLPAARQIAHKIKSSARWVGALALGDLAAQLEAMADSAPPSVVSSGGADEAALDQARTLFAAMMAQWPLVIEQLTVQCGVQNQD